LVIKDNSDISVNLDGEKIEVPKDCYEIIELEEKVTGEKFVPHVIEPSFGIDRILYFLLEHNYKDVKKNEEEYRILTFSTKMAPIKVGVFPLINDQNLIAIAEKIDYNLRNNGISTYYDTGGTIGRRYARMDEIGTPFCITVDHDSLSDSMVTIRYRDTTKQKREKISEIVEILKNEIL